jgi:hypothetical protein
MKDVVLAAQPDKNPPKGDSARRCLTPPQLATRWGCSPESIIGLIKSGRLLAFSVSPASCRRPRWRVSLEAIRVYELARNGPGAAKTRRRAKNGDVIEFF